MFDKNVLKGKRILVTGGGSGLGKEMTRHFVKHGAEVYICGRRENVLKDAADEIMSEHGGKVNYFPLDIRDAMSIEENIENVFNEGPLDGLVNNAAGNFISRTKDLVRLYSLEITSKISSNDSEFSLLPSVST